MRYELFQQIALNKDISEHKLKKGDVATIVENHASKTLENGYSLEVFNALGDTIAVVTVAESEIGALEKSQVFSVRSLETV